MFLRLPLACLRLATGVEGCDMALEAKAERELRRWQAGQVQEPRRVANPE